MARRSGGADAEVVFVVDIAPVIQSWVNSYRRARPMQMQGYGADAQYCGAISYLANESGLHERRINGILRYEQKYVTFQTAEDLLMAIDREYMLGNGEIPVAPNPSWSLERWHSYMESRGCI